jgi:hypothetical protein
VHQRCEAGFAGARPGGRKQQDRRAFESAFFDGAVMGPELGNDLIVDSLRSLGTIGVRRGSISKSAMAAA